MWTVSRQRQWPDGKCVVEISSGGRDYTNPDGLVPQYPGEFEEFEDPREAVEKAIAIAKAWQRDQPDEHVLIDHGATGGFTMPFDGQELSEDTYRGLRDWALGQWEKLVKCDRCGDIIPQSGRAKGGFTIDGNPEMGTYCSENCAEMVWADRESPEWEEVE